EHERLIDADILAEFAAAGRPVSAAAYATACRYAVQSFAWNAYQAIVWRLCAGDTALAQRVYTAVASRSHARNLFEPRPGMAELLAELRARGMRLGLAANQPAAALARLDRHGMGGYFDHREVSATLGLHKPDPRLFLAACEALGVPPAACLMVGDRIDNDIAPARALGMATVLFRTGRHRRQQPRTWLEQPDAQVRDTAGLRKALQRLNVLA
ncbi:MAG TPA: HAD family hydrolase, partial [Dehalococcoidia bacterium]|nr:HAD family hydrolase [Dehalococcoidia bacterium]